MGNTIKRTEAAEMIRKSNGSIFGVDFIKRTTGELRKMTARLGVKKHLKGGKVAYDAAQKDLIFVYDLTAEGYRTIALDAITALRINGEQYEVEA
jgi:hypothetical protein